MNTAKSTQLYRHYNSTGELLYIGISLSVLNRLGQHRDNSHWFNSIDSLTIERFNTKDEAMVAERNAIINERPYYNTIHNGKVKRVTNRLDRIHKLMDRHSINLGISCSNRMDNWAKEYNSIKELLSDDEWMDYTTNRGLNIHHCGWDCIN